jgi:hypothetical protein
MLLRPGRAPAASGWRPDWSIKAIAWIYGYDSAAAVDTEISAFLLG